jgi:hypothetical protein
MTESTFLLDEYVSVAAGEPFRLFPFGKIVKNGKIRELTRELASKIRLPHFRPPIKLGSHKEEAPAGGHITGLEVRDDGLYALIELTDKGRQAIDEGDYRYHSPEIIWEGGLENPETGDLIEGPMIIGDALLHTPHLGESTALYTVVREGDDTMTTQVDDRISVSALDTIVGWFKANEDKAPEPEPTQPEPQEDYSAVIETLEAEREEYKAKVAEYEAQQERRARVDNFAAEFDGAQVQPELFEILAEVPQELTDKLVEIIKGLAEQAKTANLTEDVGDGAADTSGDPTVAFDAAIKKKMADGSMSYTAAMEAVKVENPDLLNTYLEARK